MTRAQNLAVGAMMIVAATTVGCAMGGEEELSVRSRDARPDDGDVAHDGFEPWFPDEDTAPPSPDGAKPPLPDSAVPPPPSDTGVEPPDTALPAVDYPPGPYGTVAGAVLPNLKWKGYVDSKGAFTDLSAADYYDPSGTKGIRAIWFGMAAAWCSVCIAEASRLGLEYAAYKPRGARFVTLLIEDAFRKPAGKATADLWISTYKLVHDVGADPAMSLAPGGSFGLPYNVIVDPRTMRIVKVFEGDGPTIESTINALIKTNGG